MTVADITVFGRFRPFVIAATLPPTPGRVTTERDMPEPGSASEGGPLFRMATAQWALGLSSRGVRSSAVRLPPTVHGEGDVWFMATLVGTARDKGASSYLGDGSNRWPAVHRLDAAHLFRLALEQAPAGTVLHAIDDEGVPIRTIAEVIGKHLGVPVAAISAEDAAGQFGWLAGVLAADIPASSALTRELLGWRPAQPGLIDDLDKGHYFRRPSA